MSSGTTAHDSTWKSREQAEEAQYVRQKEQAQLAALRQSSQTSSNTQPKVDERERDFEGGFGGQEDLEDRYATTSGEH